MNEAIYLHQHESAGTASSGAEPHAGRLVGRWAVLAGDEPSGRVSLWEWPGGWDAAAAALAHPGPTGHRRLLVPAPWCPTAGISGSPEATPAACHYQERVAVEPGGARRFLDLVAEHRLPLAQRFGWSLVGAYRTALVHDSEAMLLWRVPSWHDWARWEAAQEADPSVSIWRGHLTGLVRDWRNTVLGPA